MPRKDTPQSTSVSQPTVATSSRYACPGANVQIKLIIVSFYSAGLETSDGVESPPDKPPDRY